MWICPECRSLYREPVRRCERDDNPVAEVKAHQSTARYPLLGKIVGDRYHLIGGLGQGGLGTVYLAEHRHLGQLFAVKFLDLETLGADLKKDQKDETRTDFLKEARVASLIRHDSVVRVSDFGEYQRLPFLVMEYVPGPSLLQMLGQRGRFKVPEAINIARRIAEALDAFHERRLVHRDLKPANVILDPRGDGRLMLVDLGLVKDLSGPGGRTSTHPMALRGTPGYLAPEQVPAWVLSGAGVYRPGEKQPVDARVDMYALGVIFYEILAGVSPYPDGTNNQIIVYCCTRDAIPITSVQPPVKLMPGLAELIHDTMARDPARRPQTAAAFLERLDEIAMGAAIQGSWPMMVLPGIGSSTAPRGSMAGAPSLGVLSIDIEAADDDDDDLEATAVFDEGDATHGGGFSAPSTLHSGPRAGLSEAAEPARTALGAGTLQRLGGQLPHDAHSAPPLVAPPSMETKKSGGLVYGALALVAALIGGAAAWHFTREPSPAPPAAAPTTPTRIGVSGPRPAVVPDARLKVDVIVQTPDATVVDAAPPAPDAAVVKAPVVQPPKPKPKPKRKRRWRPKTKVGAKKAKIAAPPKVAVKVDAGAPAVDPIAAQADKLVRKGDLALRSGLRDEAIGHYRAYLQVADKTHPQYQMIRNRLTSLAP